MQFHSWPRTFTVLVYFETVSLMSCEIDIWNIAVIGKLNDWVKKLNKGQMSSLLLIDLAINHSVTHYKVQFNLRFFSFMFALLWMPRLRSQKMGLSYKCASSNGHRFRDKQKQTGKWNRWRGTNAQDATLFDRYFYFITHWYVARFIHADSIVFVCVNGNKWRFTPIRILNVSLQSCSDFSLHQDIKVVHQ